MTSIGWRALPRGGAQQVIAHAVWRKSRGKKRLSMAFMDVKDPLKALEVAEHTLVMKAIVESCANAPSVVPQYVEAAPKVLAQPEADIADIAVPESITAIVATTPEVLPGRVAECAVAILASLDERANTPTTTPAQAVQVDALAQKALEQRARLQLARAEQVRLDAKNIVWRWRNKFNIKPKPAQVLVTPCSDDIVDMSDDGSYLLHIIHVRSFRGKGFMPRVCHLGEDGLNDKVIDGKVRIGTGHSAYGSALEDGWHLLRKELGLDVNPKPATKQ